MIIDARIPGWMSVGFSPDGDMIGADAVVGFPSQDEVLEYELGSKVRGGFTLLSSIMREGHYYCEYVRRCILR